MSDDVVYTYKLMLKPACWCKYCLSPMAELKIRMHLKPYAIIQLYGHPIVVNPNYEVPLTVHWTYTKNPGIP